MKLIVAALHSLYPIPMAPSFYSAPSVSSIATALGVCFLLRFIVLLFIHRRRMRDLVSAAMVPRIYTLY